MTDTLNLGEAEPGEFAVYTPGTKPCKEPGCPDFVPADAHPATLYCPEHSRGKNGDRKRERDREGAPKRNEKAPKLVLEVGGKAGRARATKADKDAQRAAETAAGAKAFMQVVAAGLAATGDNVCAGAVAGGAAQWGDAVGELSKYQPWLQSFFAPVGGDNQLGAWLGFMLATGAIALPVLAHHNLLPESIAAKMAGQFVAAEGAASSGAPAA